MIAALFTLGVIVAAFLAGPLVCGIGDLTRALITRRLDLRDPDLSSDRAHVRALAARQGVRS